jgi:hypothetical protein
MKAEKVYKVFGIQSDLQSIASLVGAKPLVCPILDARSVQLSNSSHVFVFENLEFGLQSSQTKLHC